jgi:copper ion binding protein
MNRCIKINEHLILFSPLYPRNEKSGMIFAGGGGGEPPHNNLFINFHPLHTAFDKYHNRRWSFRRNDHPDQYIYYRVNNFLNSNKMKKSFLIFLMSIFIIGSVGATDKVVKLRSENMSCGGCAGTIKKAVSALDGVSDFSADLEKRVVTITYDDQKVNVDQLKEAIVAVKKEAKDYDPNEVITRTASFRAGQMGCGGCVAKVKKNIGAETGVLTVNVDLPTKEVKVEYDANKVSAKEIRNDFQKFNYTVTRYWSSEKVKYALFKAESLDNVAELEQNLAKEKGVYDVTANAEAKNIAIAYNAETLDEAALAESIKKFNVNLIAASN